MRHGAARKQGEDSMPVVLKEKSGPRKMVSWRIPVALLDQIDAIAKKENVERTQLFEAWVRLGLEDYRQHKLSKIP